MSHIPICTAEVFFVTSKREYSNSEYLTRSLATLTLVTYGRVEVDVVTQNYTNANNTRNFCQLCLHVRVAADSVSGLSVFSRMCG